MDWHKLIHELQPDVFLVEWTIGNQVSIIRGMGDECTDHDTDSSGDFIMDSKRQPHSNVAMTFLKTYSALIKAVYISEDALHPQFTGCVCQFKALGHDLNCQTKGDTR